MQMRTDEEIEALEKRFEPQVNQPHHDSFQEDYLASIAISLKRIADAMELQAAMQKATFMR